MHIKMKDEMWNLNLQLLFADGEGVGFLIFVRFSELCR